METMVNDANFKQEVLDSDIPVLVDFWAQWCAPCHMVAPAVKAIAKEYKGRLKVCKLNVDLNPQSAAMFDVAGVPTFALLERGRAIATEVGARSKKQLLQVIRTALAPQRELPSIEISALDAAAKDLPAGKAEETYTAAD